MALYVLFLLVQFLVFSSATACDRCVHISKAGVLTSPSLSAAGACGYGFQTEYLAAAASPALYREGVGCGACFQIRCTNRKLCSRGGVRVILTDLNKSNNTDLVLGSKAFMALSRAGMASQLKSLSTVDIEYKRIPCEYKKNLAVIVEETSRSPSNLVIKFLYQGGQTDIGAVDVAQVGTSDWRFMTRTNGTVWSTSRAPAGPLQLRMVVTGGFDGKWVWADGEVLPVAWKVGAVYDTGVQISDIAQEGCSPCDREEWK